MMNWLNVGFVFSWTWEVEVFANEAHGLDSHVELWLTLSPLKVSTNLIFTWTRHVNHWDNVRSFGISNCSFLLIVVSIMIGVTRIVTLRSYRLSLFRLILIHHCSIFHDYKTWDRMQLVVLRVGIWSWEAVTHINLGFDATS